MSRYTPHHARSHAPRHRARPLTVQDHARTISSAAGHAVASLALFALAVIASLALLAVLLIATSLALTTPLT